MLDKDAIKNFKNYAYLVFVDSKNNHNKYYEIIELKDGSLDCYYGRVQGSCLHHHYSAFEKDFYSLKSSKEAKGYTDVTSLHSERERSNAKDEELSFKPVEDAEVQKVLDRIIEASRLFVSQNYTITAKQVTPKMIEEAENDLRRLSIVAARNDTGCNLYDFNRILEELFTDIPRAMTHVDAYMAKTSDDFDKIIQREADMLANLKTAVSMAQPLPHDKADKDQTVLEARGLTMRQVSYSEEDRIRDHLGKDYYDADVERRFVKAFAVENLKTRKSYEEYKKEHHITSKGVKLFYHGSKTENWYSIMQQGMSLNPNAVVTGKMFGQGLYFAPECRKALNYMDTRGSRWNNGSADTGFTAIYSVAIGKAYQPNYVLGSNFRKSDLPAGCDSVFASKKNPSLNLMNDEYIVYDEHACTIKYLMEMTSHYVPELDFNIDRKAVRNSFIDNTGSLIKKGADEFHVAINPDGMSDKARNEIASHFRGENLTDLKIIINTKSDRITAFNVPLDDGTGSKDIIPDLTKDDMKYLLREIKKNFAEGDYEWKQLMDVAKTLKVGEKITPLNSKSIDDNEGKSIKGTDKERE